MQMPLRKLRFAAQKKPAVRQSDAAGSGEGFSG